MQNFQNFSKNRPPPLKNFCAGNWCCRFAFRRWSCTGCVCVFAQLGADLRPAYQPKGTLWYYFTSLLFGRPTIKLSLAPKSANFEEGFAPKKRTVPVKTFLKRFCSLIFFFSNFHLRFRKFGQTRIGLGGDEGVMRWGVGCESSRM